MAREDFSRFHTTQWSLIAALPGRSGDPQAGRAREALEHLCTSYWRPLYTFARCRGYSAEDARDTTQAFLARIIETGGLAGADPDRGRFRSYLLGALKHFMANERSRDRSLRRGGGVRFVAGDLADLESRIATQAGGSVDADRAFDRDWAHETTAAALRQLAEEWQGRGRAEQFEVLCPVLTGEGPARSELVARLGMTENAVAVAIHRIRQRYAALVREAVARTVADEADVDSELHYLISILREK